MSRRKKPRKERGKRKPAAKWRRAKKAGIAALVWTTAAIAEQILEHYLPMILGW